MTSAYNRLPSSLRWPFQQAFNLVPFPWNLGVQFAHLHRRFWKSQRLSTDALQELQLRELRRVVSHAYRTTSEYRKRLDRVRFNPAKDFTLEDLKNIPTTTKEEIRSDPNAFRSLSIPEEDVLIHRTSGSTGTPLTVFSTRESWTAERAMMYRGWRWAGFKSGDRIVTCVGELSTPIKMYRTGMDLSSAHLGPARMEMYVRAIQKFNPHFIRTYPSIALTLGRKLKEHSIELRSLKAIWTQSETAPQMMRAKIEKLFKKPVRDYYGLQEKCAAMSECEQGTLHIHSEFGFVEFLPSGFGDFQKIVATGFFNPAMPLIRYDTGDLAVPLNTPCPCGRALPAVREIQGRMEDLLITPSGEIVQELDHVIMTSELIRESQIVQETANRVVLRVVPAAGFSEIHEKELLRKVQEKLGPDMTLSIEKTDALERTRTGKLRFVVSKLKPPTAL